MNKDVDAFKKRLRNYRYDLEKIGQLEESIEYYYGLLGADARGVDPSKEPLHCPPNKDREYDIRDKITRLDEKLSLLRAEIKYLDSVLEKIEKKHRDAIIKVVVDGKPIHKVCMEYFISKTTLQERIDKYIARALGE